MDPLHDPVEVSSCSVSDMLLSAKELNEPNDVTFPLLSEENNPEGGMERGELLAPNVLALKERVGVELDANRTLEPLADTDDSDEDPGTFGGLTFRADSAALPTFSLVFLAVAFILLLINGND